ncbi:PAP_fibrillin domain-containing protein [Haematococcus lacustris]|uniref:PAP_fibrillin domain-containing protein n=1 Tax=Haematococcus lacustris TaxID=44745 RepID=A0A6A0A0J6_HAELA|nr:PAP_fibrillin domain-containing protein [Haematococcus lacustris]
MYASSRVMWFCINWGCMDLDKRMVILTLKDVAAHLCSSLASLRVPFRTAAQTVAGLSSLSSRQVAGGSYQLTYLDDDMLIGRATALGGVFIFSRAP